MSLISLVLRFDELRLWARSCRDTVLAMTATGGCHVRCVLWSPLQSCRSVGGRCGSQRRRASAVRHRSGRGTAQHRCCIAHLIQLCTTPSIYIVDVNDLPTGKMLAVDASMAVLGISCIEYSAWVTRCSSCATSAWKERVCLLMVNRYVGE